MRLILTIFLAIVLNTSFADSKIASVIIAKGEVKALTIDYEYFNEKCIVII